MKWTTVLCIVGAASISAVPLFNGFVSKALIMSALLEEHHYWIWLAMLFASAGVVEHAGIKIPFFAFFAHDSGIRTREPPWNMLAAMTVGAVACIAIGSMPWLLYDLLPFDMDYSPYDVTHVVTQLQLLAFAIGAVVLFRLMRIYPDEIRAVNLDVEWTYRKLAPAIVRRVGSAIRAADSTVRGVALGGVNRVLGGAFRHTGPHGALARSWPTGSMVLWVAVLLAAFLILRAF
jgi:multicomponent Na+:H+ antiporter subunit D